MTVPDCLAVFVPGTDPAASRRPCGCRGTGRGQHQRACRKRKLPRCSLCTAAGLLPHEYAWHTARTCPLREGALAHGGTR